MSTGFNAARFRSQLRKYGWNMPASSNKFEVVFDRVPNVLLGVLTPRELEVFRDLRFRVQTADIPTRSFESQERRHSGPQRIMPYGLIYAPEQVEILEDEGYTIRSIFDKWQTAVFNQSNSYSVAYYDDLVCDMTVRVFDSKGQVSKQFLFKEAYPLSVQPSQMSWANNDINVVVPVEFAYREWRSQ